MTVTKIVMPNSRGHMSAQQSLRLPIIAPKDDVSSAAPTGSTTANTTSTNLIIPPRVRLPPRSRTGCWTCRSRKVKCDESRPTCGQCSRLGHLCDYSPRLSFRDDTPRIMERMLEVSTTSGNAVWDPSSRINSSPLSPGLSDLMPPFSTLTSDEERERKAEASSPGTYHVIVNPDSFSGLPEYADEFVDELNIGSLSLRRGSATSSMIDGSSRRKEREGSIETGDPNMVILNRFEDSSHRSPSSSQLKKSRLSPASDVTTASSLAIPMKLSIDARSARDLVVTQGGQDERLLAHFRDVIWKQLVQGQSTRDSPTSTPMFASVDIFEEVASTFRPLFHAMMAVSALSLAHQDGGQNIDALQHYQQAFPFLQTSLRSNEDLCSDGLFLTHFLLLIYEIAAAEPSGSNLWSHHLSRLLRISFMRISTFGSERYPYIIWWICNIDLYALLSGAGTGEFLGAILKHNMLPNPECQLYPLAPNGYSIIYPEESDNLPAVLQLHHETFALASRLGFLAARLHRGSIPPAFGNGSMSPGSFTRSAQHPSELYDIRHSLQRLWESSRTTYLCQLMNSFPQRSRELLQNALTLYHACIIYSYTSMWPRQRLTSDSASEEMIRHHTSVILQVAENIVNIRRFDLRFIVFPLFMAGVATSSGGQKMMAMDLMSSMEKEGVGRNATTTRHVLQIVYERQTQQFMTAGHSLNVDWAEVMIEQGLQVVNFGL